MSQDAVDRVIGTDGCGPVCRHGCRLSGLPLSTVPAEDVRGKFVRVRILLIEELRRNEQSIVAGSPRLAARLLNIAQISGGVAVQSVKYHNRASDFGLEGAQIDFTIERKLPAGMCQSDLETAAGNGFDGVSL